MLLLLYHESMRHKEDTNRVFLRLLTVQVGLPVFEHCRCSSINLRSLRKIQLQLCVAPLHLVNSTFLDLLETVLVELTVVIEVLNKSKERSLRGNVSTARLSRARIVAVVSVFGLETDPCLVTS